MASKLNIFNLALSHLGMKQITDATDVTTPSGKACNAYYRFARDDVFREHRWPFSTVQAVLTEWDDDDPPLPWLFAYEYPVSYDIDDLTAWSGATAYTAGQTVKYLNQAYLAIQAGTNHNPSSATTYWTVQTNAATVWTVFNEATETKKDEQDFEVYLIPGSTDEKIIVSNLDDAYMEYTFIVNDTTLWDSKFVVALSYRLAAMMAHVLTGDAAKGKELMNVSIAYIAEAKRIAAIEKLKKPNQTSSYQNSR